MRHVYSSSNGPFVALLKSILADAGIKTILRNEFLSGGIGELPPEACWPELWVANADDYDKAVAVIDRATKPQAFRRSHWVCRCCGELVEYQFHTCWQCGKQDRWIEMTQ